MTIETAITGNKSLFNKIDTNSDGKVTADEAKNNNFNLFDVNKDLSKEEFQTKLFNEHYAADTGKGLIFDVSEELTDIEKNEILSRIEEFEAYKKNLSDDELFELERNKRESVYFAVKDGDIDPSFGNYVDFLHKYEQVKQGEFSLLTNEDIMNIISYTDTTDLVQDGKIGSFNQGRTGDCWYLAMLSNYASTEEGAENIKNRISEKGGNYCVTFQNPVEPDKTEEYQITKADLQNYGFSNEITSFSSGDLDVRIMEIATAKMLLKYSDTSFMDKVISELERTSSETSSFKIPREKIENVRLSHIMTSGEAVKRALVHRAMGYSENPVIFQKHEKIAGFFLDNSPEYAQTIVKNHGTILQEMPNSNVYEVELNLKFENIDGKKAAYIDKDLKNLTDTHEQSLSEVAANFKETELVAGSGMFPYSADEQECFHMMNGHAYNIEKQNKDGFTLSNPYSSGFMHAVPKEKFDNFIVGITYLPQNSKS